MRRASHHIPEPLRSRPEKPPEPPVRERQQRRDAEEVVGEARCPRCRMPLVARMGPQGPWFPCRCPGWRAPEARGKFGRLFLARKKIVSENGRKDRPRQPREG
jgi:hypothetical protein